MVKVPTLVFTVIRNFVKFLLSFSDGALLDEASTTKPTPEQDESLLLNTDLPIFLAEPQNAFVVKNRPAVLHCRAAHALKVYFKCNGARKVETVENWFVDPQTGVRIVEADTNVTRDMVEEFFGKEKFKCECYAWNGRGNIKSQPATVEVACKSTFLDCVFPYEVFSFGLCRGCPVFSLITPSCFKRCPKTVFGYLLLKKSHWTILDGIVVERINFTLALNISHLLKNM